VKIDGFTITIGAVVGFLLGYYAVKHFRTQGAIA
jgi:hypothetical protein